MSSSGVLRSVRLVLAAAGAALIGGLGIAAPAAAYVSVAAPTGMTSGRLVPTAAGVVGLIGVVLGGLALARSAGRIGAGNGRRGAIAAMVAGLTHALGSSSALRTRTALQPIATKPSPPGFGSGRMRSRKSVRT